MLTMQISPALSGTVAERFLQKQPVWLLTWVWVWLTPVVTAGIIMWEHFVSVAAVCTAVWSCNRWCCSKHNDVGLHLQRSACFLTYWRYVCVGGIHYARNVLPYGPGVTTGLQRALQESKLFPSSRFSWSWRWPEVLCWQRNFFLNSPRMGWGMEVGSASDIFPRWTFPMILKTAERVLTWWSCFSPISPAPRHIFQLLPPYVTHLISWSFTGDLTTDSRNLNLQIC